MQHLFLSWVAQCKSRTNNYLLKASWGKTIYQFWLGRYNHTREGLILWNKKRKIGDLLVKLLCKYCFLHKNCILMSAILIGDSYTLIKCFSQLANIIIPPLWLYLIPSPWQWRNKLTNIWGQIININWWQKCCLLLTNQQVSNLYEIAFQNNYPYQWTLHSTN